MSLNSSPYYELDRIKPYRLFLIDQAVLNRFTHLRANPMNQFSKYRTEVI